MSIKVGIAALGLSTTAGGALAQLHTGDIVLDVQGGRIVTGFVGPGQSEPYFPEHVFPATFGEAPNFTNDPGMDSRSGTFAPGALVGFTIRKALRVWRGGNFETIPAEQIRVRLGPLGGTTPILTPPTDTPVVGFAMAANSSGAFHQHPGFTLQAPAGTGVYLMELELWITTAGNAVSRPYWIVFNQNDSVINQQAAMDHVYLTRVCPADRNLDRAVDFNDLLAYLNEYNAQEPGADLNGDGVVDFNDLLAFLNFYNGPCPVVE
jgi:hypothetical protein